jgi:AraC-like DNA-binding protein/mannose-6-phosphate isomerase-like protein (cupin superfamily)
MGQIGQPSAIREHFPLVQSEVRAVMRPPEPAEWDVETETTDSRPFLTGARRERCPADWGKEVSATTSDRLVVVVRGEMTAEFAGERHRVRAGESLWVPTGTAWTESVTGDAELERIVVAFDGGPVEHERAVVARDGAGRLRELCEWLVAEKHATFTGAGEYREIVLLLLLREQARLASDSAGLLEKQTRAYVLDHLDQRISLGDLASNAGMSRYYFCRLYRRLTGHSPMEGVRSIRMERARDLVRSTNLPLRVIAKQVGLGSGQHLSRLLRSQFGVGVKELRLRPRGSL